MNVYKFYDADFSGQEEYDICGTDYQQLLQCCFRYCKTVSFRLSPLMTTEGFAKELERFCVITPDNQLANEEEYGVCISKSPYIVQPYTKKYYFLTTEMQKILMNKVDGIFQWICGRGRCNPEDPVFYRADGSVFLSTIIHDGVCILQPREDEDISNIVAQGNWVIIED